MNFARAVAFIGGFTMLSRIAGFIRDVVTAAVLGTGVVADAFLIAFKLPNFFRRLFAEGAFNQAFVPLFAGALHEGGKEAARRFAREAQAALLTLVLPLSALMIVFMPYVVAALAPGIYDQPRTYELAIELSRITFPYLLFISLVSLQGAVLNSLDKFAHAAAAPIVLNLTLIAAALGLTAFVPTAGHALAWGVFAAGILQYLWLAIACAREGMSLGLLMPRFSPRVRNLLLLAMPAALGSGLQQINSMLDVVWASFLPTGSIAYLYYADRINQLPLGVVGVAIGTALLPLLSRQIKAGNHEAALANQNRAIEFALLLTLPATAGLIALHEPIIRILFERGAFDAASTVATADALAAFALGLPAFVLIKVLIPGFSARHDTKTPLYIVAVSIAANIALNLALIGPFKHVGIALASSISGWLNVAIMGFILHRRGHLKSDSQLRIRVPKLVLAAVVMGLAVGFGGYALKQVMYDSFAAGVILLAVLIGGGALVYGAITLLLKAASFAALRNSLKRQPGVKPEPTDSDA
jgi:putative peptidoglycan lipid II flippase